MNIIKNMTKIPPSIKPIIKNVIPTDARKVCTFTTNNDILGELTTSTRIHNDGHNRLITEIKNQRGKVFGHEVLNVNNERDEIFGHYIDVIPEYRSKRIKGFNFGEILRLSSIISMIENGIKNFGIFSKNTAIYFHAKYKFEPQIVGFDERNHILKDIIKNTEKQEGFENIYSNASKIMKRILEKPPIEEERELVKETSILTRDYLKKVLAQKSQKSNYLSHGMDMVLTEENLLKNREFFNELFKKHGIDYSI